MQHWINLLPCLLGLVIVTNSQAPGDGNDTCVDPTRYESRQRRLMDSWDYERLLPQPSDGTGGVWQTLDVDGDYIAIVSQCSCG